MHNVEWSGVLFYEIQGSIRDAVNLKLIIKDIFLMNRGTETYTSFNYDTDVVGHMMDNPELLGCKHGFIHSHNNMKVFFSPEDWGELYDNCMNHNIYLSLVINNRMEFIAKVVSQGVHMDTTITYQTMDENGEKYDISIDGQKLSNSLIIYDCEIISPMEKIKVSKSFHERMEEIIKIADIEEAKALADKKNTAVVKSVNNQSSNVLKPSALELDFKQPQFVATTSGVASEMEKFCVFMFNNGQMSSADIDEIDQEEIERCLQCFQFNKLDAYDVSNILVSRFNSYYKNFFDDGRIPSVENEHKIAVLKEVVNIFEYYEDKYKILSTIIMAFKELITIQTQINENTTQ